MILKLKPNRDIEKSLTDLPPKHFRQIMLKVLKLLSNPYPNDVKKIVMNNTDYLRADVGEYRIIYKVDEEVLNLVLIDKRNDDAVYKALKRK
jgi:mRNA interferase RelE/StbE